MKRPLIAFGSALALTVLSAGTSSQALLGLAIGLILVTCAALAATTLARRRVDIARTVARSEVHEADPVRLSFTVEGKGWLPVRVQVEDHGGGWLSIGDGGASLDLHVGRPGAYWLAPTRARVLDAIGVVAMRMLAGRVERLLMLPSPHGGSRVELSHLGLLDEPEPQGVLPYAPGTPLTRIHWPALARGAGLQMRHFAPPAGGLPLVVVDTAGTPSPGALDWAARTAAGYIVTLVRRGGCRVMLPGDSDATTVAGLDDTWRTVHRRLAMLGDLPRQTPAALTAGIRVRASAAPSTLAPAPPLPPRVLVATRCA